jgi:hypothetical protein
MTVATASPEPTSTATAPKPRVIVRPGRVADVRGLVRFYLGLSPEARYRFHPFPFRPFAAGYRYFLIVLAQTLFGRWMGRFPRALVGLVVARLEGRDEIVGYGTMRGVVWKGLEPRVRFGFVVGDGFRGYGIGPQLLRGLSVIAVGYGMRWEIGAVFKSDAVAIRALTKFGVKFFDSDYIDPRAPNEQNYWTEGDLHEILRLIPEYPAPPTARVNPAWKVEPVPVAPEAPR